MKRTLGTRLDVLKPDIGQLVQEKQRSQVYHHNKKCKERKFHQGDKVLLRKYHTKNIKWIPGTIVKCMRSCHYLVKTCTGCLRKCHIDQLLPDSPKQSVENDEGTFGTEFTDVVMDDQFEVDANVNVQEDQITEYHPLHQVPQDRFM